MYITNEESSAVSVRAELLPQADPGSAYDGETLGLATGDVTQGDPEGPTLRPAPSRPR